MEFHKIRDNFKACNYYWPNPEASALVGFGCGPLNCVTPNACCSCSVITGSMIMCGVMKTTSSATGTLLDCTWTLLTTTPNSGRMCSLIIPSLVTCGVTWSFVPTFLNLTVS